MEMIGRFTPTGKRLVGPGADLVELDGENNLRHTAIVFLPQYRTHRAINDALEVVRGFLEAPLVAGLLELVDHDREMGAFVYPTGVSWSVAEVIRIYADLGEAPGTRAGLELMYGAGQILAEAAERGAGAGVYSHGGLTPWRVMLKPDGQAAVIGHALPQVEILQFFEDPSQVPREESFRYCPPERIEFQPEQLSSDLFGLALVSFELMTGKPVYDGLVDDIRQQAARGEGSRRLYKFRDQIPDGVRQLLTTALRPAFADRHPSGDAFLDETKRLLSSPEAKGPSLMEVMERVVRQGKRLGKAVEGGRTLMADRDELKKLVSIDDEPAAAPKAAAWSTPERGRRQDVRIPAGTAAAAPKPPVNAGPKLADRLFDRMRGEEPAARSEPARGTADLAQAILNAPDSEEGPRFTPGRVRKAPRRSTPGEEISASMADPLSEEAPAPEEAPPEAKAPEPRTGPPPEPRLPPPPEPKLPPPAPEVRTGATPPPVVVPLAETRPVTALPPPRTPPSRAAPTPPPVPRTPTPPPEPVSNEIDPDSLPALAPDTPPALRASDPPKPPAAPPKPPVEMPTIARASLPPEPRRPAASTGFLPAPNLARAPDSLLTGRKGGVELFNILREPGGKAVRIRLPLKSTVGEAVSFLVGSVFPVRADLSGSLTGWYRLDQDGKALSPGAFLETVDTARPLLVRFVQNQVVFADIEVIGGPAPVRFVAPVGTAVPIATLVDHLEAWLGLPDGRWMLHRDGRPLDPHAILADEEAPTLRVLQLRVVDAEETDLG